MKRTGAAILPLAVGSLVMLTTFALAMAAPGAYRLIKKIPIPGDGGWDGVVAGGGGTVDRRDGCAAGQDRW